MVPAGYIAQKSETPTTRKKMARPRLSSFTAPGRGPDASSAEPVGCQRGQTRLAVENKVECGPVETLDSAAVALLEDGEEVQA
jgi:hypothetical protein